MNLKIEISPKKMFILFLLFIFVVGCVHLFMKKYGFTKEGLDEIPIVDSNELLDIPKNNNGNPDINLIPTGYYKRNDTKMARIPYGYSSPDKTTLIAITNAAARKRYGILSDSADSAQPVPDGNGTLESRVPNGYYLLNQNIYPNKMAIIPDGYTVAADKRTLIMSNGSTRIQTGISTNNAQPVPGGAGTLESRVPDGYYLLNRGLEQMARIPDGYTVSADKTTLQQIDTTYKKLTDASPDYHIGEAALLANQKSSDATEGITWVKDKDGKMVALPKSSVQGDILYYTPGSYPFGPSNYVPKYEDSVFLSRLTGSSMTTPVYTTSSMQGGFCTKYENDPLKLEEICRTIDADKCGSTNCCVLLGGSKCVAGDDYGPTQKTNYADVFIRNRDYYYYQGKCFGNCPDNP
jgi:hypothetical protein